jgi:hypothetical protein
VILKSTITLEIFVTHPFGTSPKKYSNNSLYKLENEAKNKKQNF